MHSTLVLLIWVFCFYCLLVCLYSVYISIGFKMEVWGASFGHHYTAKVTPHPLPSPFYWTYFSLEYWHFHAWFNTRVTSDSLKRLHFLSIFHRSIYLFAIIKTARVMKAKWAAAIKPEEHFGRDQNQKWNFGRDQNRKWNFGRDQNRKWNFGRDQNPARNFGRDQNWGKKLVATKNFGRDQKLGEENEKGYYNRNLHFFICAICSNSFKLLQFKVKNI